MQVSRRMFLGTLAASTAAARVGAPHPRCRVVDLGAGCLLKESLLGFRSALDGVGDDDGANDPATHLILPGAGLLSEAVIAEMYHHLRRGGAVLLECGFGFTGGEEFARHRTFFRTQLDLSTAGPVPARGVPYFPYVQHTWPIRAVIREFQPVALHPAPGDEIAATFAGRPVALRRRVGSGVLLALGSPIGPMLRAGDRDAEQWLRAFCGLRAPD